MSLRPRYSLLTLLVLTALVAGGVKLWYGPHHVVEQVAANVEREYSYTRDWRGNKLIDGPHVERNFEQGKLIYGQITWYRQGELVPLWEYQILVIPEEFPDQKTEPIPQDDQGKPYITPAERVRLQEIVEREKLQPLPPGRKFSVRELLFYPSVLP